MRLWLDDSKSVCRGSRRGNHALVSHQVRADGVSHLSSIFCYPVRHIFCGRAGDPHASDDSARFVVFGRAFWQCGSRRGSRVKKVSCQVGAGARCCRFGYWSTPLLRMPSRTPVASLTGLEDLIFVSSCACVVLCRRSPQCVRALSEFGITVSSNSNYRFSIWDHLRRQMTVCSLGTMVIFTISSTCHCCRCQAHLLRRRFFPGQSPTSTQRERHLQLMQSANAVQKCSEQFLLRTTSSRG